MAARTDVAAEPAERVLVLTRVFDAPRELVFKAWTEREHDGHRGGWTECFDLLAEHLAARKEPNHGPDK